ncbi:MAG: hypothetical protein M1376_10875 [Planctomycetes bacterium]|nr:hypothetical protein [Planctomycetota bacterium]
MLPLLRIEKTRVGRAIERSRSKNFWTALGARLAAQDRDRQARIARYQERAALRLPLFQ